MRHILKRYIGPFLTYQSILKNPFSVIEFKLKRLPIVLFFLKSGEVFITRSGSGDMAAIRHIYGIKEYGSPPSEEKEVMIDIGGNIGISAVYFSKKFRKILSYEPHPDNFKMLMSNIWLNNFKDKIQAFQQAVSDKEGHKALFLKDSLSHSLYDTIDMENKGKISVPCTTLSKIFKENNLEKVDFLKIDAEGSEYEILTETPMELLKRIDEIRFEYHFPKDNRLEEISAQLEKAGFEINIIDNHDDFPLIHCKRVKK